MTTKLALIQFPGSNCDRDVIDAFSRHFQIAPTLIWHSETKLPKVDGVILPGGFSFGDYLRSGSLASHSQIMQEVKAFAKKGGPVLGICNGFQILTESQILPGALLHNKNRKFICQYSPLRPGTGSSSYHSQLSAKSLTLPIAHGEGRYYIDPKGLEALEKNGQVALRYDGPNPNGSVGAVAGITSLNGRVLGLMPHPERACDKILGGSNDGLLVLKAFLNSTM